MKLENLLHYFQDEAWLAFHGGEINDSDDFYQYFHDYINTAVIYDYACKEYLTNNEEYYFLDHDVYGRPDDIYQAAFICIYDYFVNNNVFDLWNEMEKVLDEAIKEIETECEIVK